MNVSGQSRRQARMIVPISLLVIPYLSTTPTIQVDSLCWEDRLFLISVVRHGSAELLSHQLSNFVPKERRESPQWLFTKTANFPYIHCGSFCRLAKTQQRVPSAALTGVPNLTLPKAVLLGLYISSMAATRQLKPSLGTDNIQHARVVLSLSGEKMQNIPFSRRGSKSSGGITECSRQFSFSALQRYLCMGRACEGTCTVSLKGKMVF